MFAASELYKQVLDMLKYSKQEAFVLKGETVLTCCELSTVAIYCFANSLKPVNRQVSRSHFANIYSASHMRSSSHSKRVQTHTNALKCCVPAMQREHTCTYCNTPSLATGPGAQELFPKIL